MEVRFADSAGHPLQTSLGPAKPGGGNKSGAADLKDHPPAAFMRTKSRSLSNIEYSPQPSSVPETLEQLVENICTEIFAIAVRSASEHITTLVRTEELDHEVKDMQNQSENRRKSHAGAIEMMFGLSPNRERGHVDMNSENGAPFEQTEDSTIPFEDEEEREAALAEERRLREEEENAVVKIQAVYRRHGNSAIVERRKRELEQELKREETIAAHFADVIERYDDIPTETIVCRWRNFSVWRAWNKLHGYSSIRARLRRAGGDADSNATHWVYRRTVKRWRRYISYVKFIGDPEVDEAVVKIQTAFRGLMARKKVFKEVKNKVRKETRIQEQRRKEQEQMMGVRKIVPASVCDLYLPKTFHAAGMGRRKKNNPDFIPPDLHPSANPNQKAVFTDTANAFPKVLERAMKPIWTFASLPESFSERCSACEDYSVIPDELAGPHTHVRQAVHELRLRIFEADHFEVLKATEHHLHNMNNTALQLLCAGRTKQGLEILNQVDSILSNPQGFNFPTRLQLLSLVNNNIAYAHLKLNNDYDCADCLFRALKFAKHLQFSHAVAFTMNNLGCLYNKLMNQDMAFNYFQESLEILKKLYDLEMANLWPEVYRDFSGTPLEIWSPNTLGFSVVYHNLSISQLVLLMYDAAVENLANAMAEARSCLPPGSLWFNWIQRTLTIFNKIQPPYRKKNKKVDVDSREAIFSEYSILANPTEKLYHRLSKTKTRVPDTPPPPTPPLDETRVDTGTKEAIKESTKKKKPPFRVGSAGDLYTMKGIKGDLATTKSKKKRSGRSSAAPGAVNTTAESMQAPVQTPPGNGVFENEDSAMLDETVGMDQSQRGTSPDAQRVDDEDASMELSLDGEIGDPTATMHQLQELAANEGSEAGETNPDDTHDLFPLPKHRGNQLPPLPNRAVIEEEVKMIKKNAKKRQMYTEFLRYVAVLPTPQTRKPAPTPTPKSPDKNKATAMKKKRLLKPITKQTVNIQAYLKGQSPMRIDRMLKKAKAKKPDHLVQDTSGFSGCTPVPSRPASEKGDNAVSVGGEESPRSIQSGVSEYDEAMRPQTALESLYTDRSKPQEKLSFRQAFAQEEKENEEPKPSLDDAPAQPLPPEPEVEMEPPRAEVEMFEAMEAADYEYDEDDGQENALTLAEDKEPYEEFKEDVEEEGIERLEEKSEEPFIEEAVED